MIGDLFNTILIDPLTNLFVFLATLTGNAGLAIILLTIIIRLVTLPLALRQMHSMRMMAAISPRMQDIQKRYKDPRRRSEEQMKLYKEAGINPLGCASGMLLQMPILIALYRTFTLALGEAPEAVIRLTGRLYDWHYLQSGLPLNADFLWLHLGRPDPLGLPMPLLVAASTYVYQKMTMMPTTDERQQAQMAMTNLMMPLLFGWITFNLPSGLGLYYVLTNLIGMVMQYLYIGGGPINWRAILGMSSEPVLPRALQVRQLQVDRFKVEPGADDEEGATNGAQPARGPKTPVPTNGQHPDDAAARRKRRYASGRRRGRR